MNVVPNDAVCRKMMFSGLGLYRMEGKWKEFLRASKTRNFIKQKRWFCVSSIPTSGISGLTQNPPDKLFLYQTSYTTL